MPLVATNGDGQLRAGAASVDITPAVGCHMQGYRLRIAEAISDRLHANALAVGRQGPEWLLLTVDCIGLDRDFVGSVRNRLTSALGVPGPAITINCSHTHSGPATIANLYGVEADQAYLRTLEEQLVRVADEAVRRMRTVRWRFGMVDLAENVNRRVVKYGKVELGVNPRGPLDTRLRVIRIDEPLTSTPVAFIVHYACHATVSGGVPHISADWPGRMRTTVQRAYSGDSPVVCFVQGCAGDVTHRIARDAGSWPTHFGHHTAVQADILGRLCGAAAVTAGEHAVAFRADTIQTVASGLALSYANSSGAETTEVQVIRLGPAAETTFADDAVWLAALPGEPFVEYGMEIGARLHRESGVNRNRVLVCGYSNDAIGYLCTPRALRQGGYEAEQAHLVYNRPAAFSASAQSRTWKSVSDAAFEVLRSHGERVPVHTTAGAGLKKRLSRLLF